MKKTTINNFNSLITYESYKFQIDVLLIDFHEDTNWLTINQEDMSNLYICCDLSEMTNHINQLCKSKYNSNDCGKIYLIYNNEKLDIKAYLFVPVLNEPPLIIFPKKYWFLFTKQLPNQKFVYFKIKNKSIYSYSIYKNRFSTYEKGEYKGKFKSSSNKIITIGNMSIHDINSYLDLKFLFNDVHIIENDIVELYTNIYQLNKPHNTFMYNISNDQKISNIIDSRKSPKVEVILPEINIVYGACTNIENLSFLLNLLMENYINYKINLYFTINLNFNNIHIVVDKHIQNDIINMRSKISNIVVVPNINYKTIEDFTEKTFYVNTFHQDSLISNYNNLKIKIPFQLKDIIDLSNFEKYINYVPFINYLPTVIPVYIIGKIVATFKIEMIKDNFILGFPHLQER